jgi:hypothetical protein
VSPTLPGTPPQSWEDLRRAFDRVSRTLPYTGNGSPENVVTAPVGSLYTRRDGGAGTTLYVKESGTGNTGWVPK